MEWTPKSPGVVRSTAGSSSWRCVSIPQSGAGFSEGDLDQPAVREVVDDLPRAQLRLVGGPGLRLELAFSVWRRLEEKKPEFGERGGVQPRGAPDNVLDRGWPVRSVALRAVPNSLGDRTHLPKSIVFV